MTTQIKTYVDDHHHDVNSDKVFGFWVYIMTDCMLFTTLFTVFAATGQAPSLDGVMPRDLFNLNFVLVETMFLLASSFTFGMAMLAMQRDELSGVFKWLFVTMGFGLGFLAIELYEFYELTVHYNAPMTSHAYWAIFYGLVGTHGLHVTSGIIWMITLLVAFKRDGLNAENKMRLSCLSLFWHFLDIVWIGVFTMVYLMGVL